MAARRDLSFATLDDAVRDAERLLAAGYDKAGNWDLAQCCGHVAEWMRYGMDGFPRGPLPVRALLWGLRNTFGRRLLLKTLAAGKMPTGGPTAPQSVFPAGQDDAVGVAKLRDVVGRMVAFSGEPVPSPMFGRLTRDEWLRMHQLHAAHHLSFLVPKHG